MPTDHDHPAIHAIGRAAVARSAGWWLGVAAAGSLALHGIALGILLVGIPASVRPTDAAAIIVVFVEASPATQDDPANLAQLAAALPLPPETPPPDFRTPNPTLPPPPEALPPPDFRQSRPIPSPTRRAPASASRQETTPPAAAASPTAPKGEGYPNSPAQADAMAIVSPGWNALIAAWLAAHKRYPETARRRNEAGDVTVRFTVAANGHVTEVTVAAPSGSAVLDEAALSMLRGATLPAPGVEATRTVRIHYRLGD